MNKAHAFRRPSPRAAGSQAALAWLGSDTVAASVLATARRHIQIRQAVGTVLPAGLGAACQVVKVDGPCLTIAVPNAAYAAKLRQLAPRLAEALTRAGWHIHEVKVRIHAGPSVPAPYTPPPKEAIPLDDQALAAFTVLRNQLRPGPLADAVARLVRHHGGTSGA